jgi:protein TonB
MGLAARPAAQLRKITCDNFIRMTLCANSAERLVAPPRARSWREDPRFLFILVLCLVTHALLIAFLLREDVLGAALLTPEQEIPVEVVTLPPPEPEPEQPPAPKQNEPPPKQKIQEEEYEKPAFDAPKAESKETVEREAAKDETKSPNVAPPKEEASRTPEDAKEASASQPAQQEPSARNPAEKQLDDKADAEIVESASPTPEPEPDKSAAPENSDSPKQKIGSIADQIAALAPIPDFQLGSAAKHSPVSGGNAKTSYLSILYGLIVPRMHIPAKARHAMADGLVAFYVDERGNLTHQAVVKSSGVAALDAAAISAVRRAAPFPAPPRGHPRSILFHYNTK